MKTTADFLDELQRKLGVESDYALGKLMGMQRQHVSHYRTLKTTFDDEKCIKIAEILGADAAEIILAMHYQRAKQPEVKAVWERMAMNIGAVGAVAACALIVLALPYSGVNSGLEYTGLIGSIAAAQLPNKSSNIIYIMRILTRAIINKLKQ
jgi:hypothetical protein